MDPDEVHRDPEYRLGFEAALRVDGELRSYGEAQAQLRAIAPEAYEHEPFRAGFERGLAFRDALRADPGDAG